MIVEIHGAGFQNKGAELMLRTTVSELKTRIDRLEIAIDPSYGTYEERCQLQLRQIVPCRGHVGGKRHAQNLRKQSLFGKSKLNLFLKKLVGLNLESYGCIEPREIDALIDISGFAYTDQWGIKPTEDFANLAEFYRKRGKPVIMMPQAFGPFGNEEIKSHFRRIIENSTLILPRDKVSYKYVQDIYPDSKKVVQAPDITIFHPRKEAKPDLTTSDYACLVPNARMLDQGKKAWGIKYEDFLFKIASEIIAQGLRLYIVVHDASGQDVIIADNLLKKISSSRAQLLDEQDPYSLKTTLGQSKMVIGSRFHSLVASLSQTVPAIAIGWSHKYEMLFEDFGLDSFIVSPETPLNEILGMIHQLSDNDTNLRLREIITQQLSRLEEKNQEMWDSVVEVLGKSIN